MTVSVRFPQTAARLALPATLALAALAIVLAGCSHRSYRDDASGDNLSAASRLLGSQPGDDGWRAELGRAGRQRYPLAVGNRWDYDIHTEYTVISNDVPQPPEVLSRALRAEISGTASIAEHEYFLRAESDPRIVSPFAIIPFATIYPTRQDRSGLYERDPLFPRAPSGAPQDDGSSAATDVAVHGVVDRVVADPAARAAFQRAADQLVTQLAAARSTASGRGKGHRGGPDPEEISMLRYPLFVGARWIVRDSPRFGRFVVSRERVKVPAGVFTAWKLRGTSELFGPRDRVRLWYASAGLVRISIHIESDATDEAGNVIGRLVADENQVLTSLSLVDPNEPHTLAVTPLEDLAPRQ